MAHACAACPLLIWFSKLTESSSPTPTSYLNPASLGFHLCILFHRRRSIDDARRQQRRTATTRRIFLRRRPRLHGRRMDLGVGHILRRKRRLGNHGYS